MLNISLCVVVLQVDVYLENEAFSSKMAEDLIQQFGTKADRKDKEIIDKLSACYILNRFIRRCDNRPMSSIGSPVNHDGPSLPSI